MARKQKGLNSVKRDAPRSTRRKADTWDRIKFLVLLTLVTVAIVASSPDLGFLPFTEVFLTFLASTTGTVIAVLFGLEMLRQIHYFVSERSAAYHSFWQHGVFGGFERWSEGNFKPWTRFRVGRMFRFAFYLLLLGLLIDYFVDDVSGPVEALVQAPRILADLLPFVFQLAFGFMFIAVQFIGIFWLLSRGGMDVILPEEVTTRFDDVWGQDHVLDLIKENIAFLEKPDEIEQRGGYLPGGVLLWGPPGTGKTLMAQAMAGETGKPFVFVEPGAFINMFFGIGILKVKSLYRKLRKLSLRHGGVIVFFDEADSLGSRGQLGAPQGQLGATMRNDTGLNCNGFTYLSAGAQNALVEHWGLEVTPEEKPRRWLDRIMMGGAGMGGGGMGTLQALLTEMNGLAKPRGITNRFRKLLGFKPKPAPKYRILHIMATNMPNALDEAMLRPGRIDRIYKVGFPSKEGRKQTIVGYLNKVEHKLGEAEIDKLATVTPYYSGAKIKDMVNEALIIAVRDGRDSIQWSDIWKAKALKELGPPEDVDYVQRERHAVAIHEASHAVAAHLLGAHRRIDMVSIEKRASTLGMVKSQGEEERFTQWRSEFEADIMVSLASLAGERMFFEGDNSSGVSGDLSSASTVAALMEGTYGMGASLTSALNTRQTAAGGPASPVAISLRENRTAVEESLSELYDRVADLIEENRDKVLELAAVLEQRKNISGDEVAEIMGSEPGSHTMREPKGWQRVSDQVAGDRQREALARSGREAAAVGAAVEVEASEPDKIAD